MRNIRFNDVPARAVAQRFLRYFMRTVLADEEDLGGRGDLSDSMSGFNPVECRKANIQKDQVRLQLLGLLNGFQTIRNFSDDLQFVMCEKRQTDEAPPRLVIINHEDANRADLMFCLKGVLC